MAALIKRCPSGTRLAMRCGSGTPYLRRCGANCSACPNGGPAFITVTWGLVSGYDGCAAAHGWWWVAGTPAGFNCPLRTPGGGCLYESDALTDYVLIGWRRWHSPYFDCEAPIYEQEALLAPGTKMRVDIINQTDLLFNNLYPVNGCLTDCTGTGVLDRSTPGFGGHIMTAYVGVTPP